MANFASILDKPVSEIERPKALPIGTYLCIIRGLPRYDKSAKKQTPFVEFTAAFQQAMDDVDKDDLKVALTSGDGSNIALNSKEIKLTYYDTDDAGWRLKKFIEDIGFDLDDMAEKGETLRQACESANGSQVYVQIKHRASQDGKTIFAEVADTAKVD